ncbi:CPBP family glutamic-type intramembrane protease [Proteiniborus sp.]|uniref:CPBP family glutamic-type intramembrane protease n=1 Tax=Proteiniborus sp. TaxID=2079015 RepID=UPI003333E5E0
MLQKKKPRITPVNFIYVSLYITFGNSFLEEIFFRGFIFNFIKTKPKNFLTLG